MMKKNFNKKVKGFTLIELIVVIAIFGMIMAAALNLVAPVEKLFRNTAQYEQTRAAIDNTQRYLSGTLRYADRFAMYIQYTNKDTSSLENVISDANIESNVANFAGQYFHGGEYADALTDPVDTPVYVLVFDNENYKISKYTFSPSSGRNWTQAINYDDSTGKYSMNSMCQSTFQEYAINEELFEEYGFQVYLGSYEYTTIINAEGEEQSVLTAQNYNEEYYPSLSNLAFTIIGSKKVTDDTGTISYESLYQSTALSFSLVNIIDTNTVNGLSATAISKTDSQRYYDSTNYCFGYTTEVARGKIYPSEFDSSIMDGAPVSESFYIIYTLSDRAETYQNNNQINYDYKVTTTS